MRKAATVQARMDAGLKRKADAVFKKIGLNSSQVINALYSQVVMCKGIPFELKVPNKETIAAIKELEEGGGKNFLSFEAMIDDLENDDDA